MIEINQLYNMDCVPGMRLLDDNCIDLTVTSPPYDNLRDYKGYHFDATDVIKQLYRVTKNGGVVVWVVGDATISGSETGTSFRQALHFKDIGFNLHDTMIWYKPNAFNLGSNNCYVQSFEYMFILSKGTPRVINFIYDKENKSMGHVFRQFSKNKKGENIKTGKSSEIKEFGKRRNVWFLNVGEKEVDHPAVFPKKIASEHIYSWSNEGDTVLDPFMGSGTTAVAAMKYNRNWIGFEISKEYCDIANQRIENHKRQLKLF